MSGCKKEDSATSPDDSKVGGSLTYNGYTYHTVTIGTQEWTVENLRTTAYNDGTTISKVTDSTEWEQRADAYCAYNNDESNVIAHGYLYNFTAVSTGKLAPSTGGWRVPTNDDWTKLTNYLGANSGIKLKSKEGWDNIGNGTDNYGFNALPSGYRGIGFSGIGNISYWWSSSADQDNYSVCRFVRSSDASLKALITYKGNGLSIRLVRDK